MIAEIPSIRLRVKLVMLGRKTEFGLVGLVRGDGGHRSRQTRRGNLVKYYECC